MTLDLRSLAAFRMAIGAIVCADALLRTRDFGLMFGADGMFPIAVLQQYYGDHWAWSLAFFFDADWWSAAVLALEGIAGLLLAAGLGTRWATIAAWAAVVSVVRRTAPATNAGDLMLCCLLFWGMFLPLGAVWSVDSRLRRRQPAVAGVTETQISSIASLALVLQIAAVYLSAGLAKWNGSWLSGDAIAYALSLHDHGTPLGSRLAACGPVVRLLTWGVVATETIAPCLLVAVPYPPVRLALALLFIAFHGAVAVLMTVGLFASVGMAAWLAVLPGFFWDWLASSGRIDAGAAEVSSRWLVLRSRSEQSKCSSSFRRPRRSASGVFGAAASWPEWLCGACLVVAAVSFVHANTFWRDFPLPRPLAAVVNLCCLGQDWSMFGDVPRQQQWVYGRAELADGRVVDLLRGGRPLEAVLPAGGFSSLPHHRWHKIFWELPKPAVRIFSPSIAAAIAQEWNQTHPESARAKSLEIRFARITSDTQEGTLHELLLATWPPRGATGSGNLDRLLEEQHRPPRD